VVVVFFRARFGGGFGRVHVRQLVDMMALAGKEENEGAECEDEPGFAKE
jgi:hypothetical protein